MKLPQYDPTLLQHHRTSLIHTITLIIHHLPNSTLNDLDTTSQTWASVISSLLVLTDNKERTYCSRLPSLLLYVLYLLPRGHSPLHEDTGIHPLLISSAIRIRK